MSNERRSQLSRIMRRGHELASKMVGDYKARLSLALQLAWKEEKGEDKMELPKLEGTEKQIKWAEDIRTDVLDVIRLAEAEIEEVASKLSERKKKTKGEYVKKYSSKLCVFEEEIKNNTSAVFFIDNFKGITRCDIFDKIQIVRESNVTKGVSRLFNKAQQRVNVW